MKNMKLFSKMLVFFLAVSTASFGQYTGTNGNVALGKVIVATDSVTGFPPGNAVDGAPSTYCQIPGTAPAWIQINLEKFHYIDGYGVILPLATELPRSFILQVSADGATWTDLVTQSVSQDSMFTADLDAPDPIKFVRIYMTAKDDPAAFSEIVIFGDEMEIPERPISLAATNITTTSFTANWEVALRASGYVLQVATDANFNNILPGYDLLWWDTEVLSWDVTDVLLDPGTDYFYKVRAFNLAGTSSFGNVISLTTEKAEQTITFDVLAAAIYGDSDFDLAATATSGLAVTYTSTDISVATIIGSTMTIVGAGTSSITAAQAGNDQYLEAPAVLQDLVVNVKPLSIINATVANKVYDGNTDAVISGAALDGLVGDDDVSLSNADAGVFAQANVGTAIEVSSSMVLTGVDMLNYSLNAAVLLSADITGKDLDVIADDTNREACASNPDFTLSYSGFVGTEDVSVVDPLPSASCSADENSAPGAYDITVTGGLATNYVLVYISGSLTVTPDVTDPVLEVQNTTVQLDAGNIGAITAEDVLVSSDDNCGITNTVLSQNIFSDSDIGDVNVDVTVSDAAGNETTKIAVVTVLGFVGIGEVDGIRTRVYPNPTYDIVQIETDRFADELKVMDITGKTILSISDPGKQASIDLSDYHSGIYVIHLRFGNDVLYYKLVKK